MSERDDSDVLRERIGHLRRCLQQVTLIVDDWKEHPEIAENALNRINQFLKYNKKYYAQEE